MDDVAAVTEESTALAKQLKKLGFRFVGPTKAIQTKLGKVLQHTEFKVYRVRSPCLDDPIEHLSLGVSAAFLGFEMNRAVL